MRPVSPNTVRRFSDCPPPSDKTACGTTPERPRQHTDGSSSMIAQKRPTQHSLRLHTGVYRNEREIHYLKEHEGLTLWLSTQGKLPRVTYARVAGRPPTSTVLPPLNPCTVVRPPDGSFGNKLPNGSWTGMVGQVGRKEVDMGLGPYGVIAERTEVIDYTTPVMSDYLRILGGQGIPEVNPWGFLLPLDMTVWAALVGALVLVLATMFVLASILPIKTPVLSLFIRMTLRENTWVPAERWWERLMMASWMLVMLVLTQSYTSNLMSLLAVRYIPQPFQTLRGLLASRATTMVWEYNTAYVSYFRTSKSGIFREVHEVEHAGRIRYTLSTEYLNMLDQLVRRGPYVYVGEDLTIKVLLAEDFSKTGRCDFYTSRESFMPFLYCMIASKNSPLVPAVSKRITWMREAGLYDYWMKSLKSNSTVCLRPPSKITVRSSLALSNVWGMFVVYGVGHVLGLLALGVELLAHRFSPTH
ncbi:probable glutamate receptor [Cherax quadricarinatus]|uniref:probable glutamate receptor n=1 Tax=Cherax quadricarinatus TaxID=27406 RepID=UPI00387E7E6D